MQRIAERLSETSRRRHRERQKRRQANFVRGPIPLDWLARAAPLPGKALAVGLAIWFCAGLRRRRDHLSICGTLLERFGVRRHAGYRGLTALERAGLVTVERRCGRCPRVTILTDRGLARGPTRANNHREWAPG